MIDFKELYSELRGDVIRELGAITDICQAANGTIPSMLVPYKGGENNGKDVMIDGETPDWLAVYQSAKDDADMRTLIENARKQAEKRIVEIMFQIGGGEIANVDVDYMGIDFEYNRQSYNLATIKADFHTGCVTIVGERYIDDLEEYSEHYIELTDSAIRIADLRLFVTAMETLL